MTKALVVSSETTIADVVNFMVDRAKSPHCVGEAVVFDFNNNPFDKGKFVESEVPAGSYVIPFSMSESWGDMVQLLPPKVAALPRLRFNARAERGGYSVACSLIPVDCPEERRVRMEIAAAFEA